MKFTAKYEIQIENEKSFQVAKRIIGPRVLFFKLRNNNYYSGILYEEYHCSMSRISQEF